MKALAVATLTLAAMAEPCLADPVDEIVAEQMAVSHLPGVGVAIIDDGKMTKLMGYGTANLEWQSKVDVDTRFQLASATKLFTGILLMRSVEQGKLTLDDPLSKFLPEAPSTWSAIRVRQLANHTSGLSESLGDPRPKTVAEAVAASEKQPLAYQPGSEARYGFTDFTILRAIIEKVNSMTLPQLLDVELVRPLGLTGTGFAMAEDDGRIRTSEILHKKASIYGWTGERQRNSDFFFEPLGYGAGGLYSSPRDLAKLFAALDNGQLLKPDSLQELTTPAILPGGKKTGFGIGWTVRSYHGVPVVGHSGGPALADIFRIPSQRRTIVVLTNQQNFFPLLAERIADLTIKPERIGEVVDDQPRIATNLLGIFAAARSGADDAVFVAKGSKPSDPLRNGFGKALIEGVGPLQKASLVRVEQDGSRIYRLHFQRKQWDWSVRANSEGRISDMHPV